MQEGDGSPARPVGVLMNSPGTTSEFCFKRKIGYRLAVNGVRLVARSGLHMSDQFDNDGELTALFFEQRPFIILES